MAIAHSRSISFQPRLVGAVSGAKIDHCTGCESRGESICSVIDLHDLDRLAQAADMIKIEAGTAFMAEGEAAASFFNITSGTVKLFKLLPDGRRQVTGFARKGTFLGLAVSSTYAFTAEAIDDVTCCRFSRKRMLELMHDFPAMERRLLENASNELVSAQEQMLLLGRKTARERIASFLILQAVDGACCAKSKTGSTMIRLPMNRTDIADYLGLTIETVSRSFTKLKTEKLLAIPDAHTVEVLNMPALRALAGGFASGE